MSTFQKQNSNDNLIENCTDTGDFLSGSDPRKNTGVPCTPNTPCTADNPDTITNDNSDTITNDTNTHKEEMEKVVVINDKVEKDHPLNDRWWLWTHGMKDEDWSFSSYKRLGDPIVTIEQFLGLNRKLVSCVADSMFFLMRHGPNDDDNPICPMWEDPICIKGGAWKFKVTRNDAAKAWTDIAIRLIGETITKNPGDILGVSISPKKTFVTIRIWNKDAKKCDQAQLQIPDSEYFRNVIYDVHSDYKDKPQAN
ncbi:MAG: eukaryotic translation initiation factor 4E [Candidatus Paceibacterota bacterium]